MPTSRSVTARIVLPRSALVRIVRRSVAWLCAGLLLAGCGGAWNDPYPDDGAQVRAQTLYSAFNARPKHLDPARAYTSDA